jgi:hypothetical protein
MKSQRLVGLPLAIAVLAVAVIASLSAPSVSVAQPQQDQAKAHNDGQASVHTRAVAATPSGGIAVLALDESGSTPIPTLTVFDASGTIQSQWGGNASQRIFGGSLYTDPARPSALYADTTGFTVVGLKLDPAKGVVIPTCQRLRVDGTTQTEVALNANGLDLTQSAAFAVADGIVLVAEDAIKIRPDCTPDSAYGGSGRGVFADVELPPSFVFDSRSTVSSRGEVIRVDQASGGDGRTRLVVRKLQANGAAIRPASVFVYLSTQADGEQVRLSTTGFARADGTFWLRAGSDARPCLFAVVPASVGAEGTIRLIECPDAKNKFTTATLDGGTDALLVLQSTPFSPSTTLHVLDAGATTWRAVGLPSLNTRYTDALMAATSTTAQGARVILDTARGVRFVGGQAQLQAVQPRVIAWQPTVRSLGAVTAVLAGDSASRPFPATGVAVGFFNGNLLHFFVTADGAEAAGIDRGAAGAGWLRTNDHFNVWTKAEEAPADAKPVCRFYGTPGLGPNSHFYTANPAECEAVKRDRGWTFEGNAFYVLEPVAGTCANSDTIPIYRFYNNGFAKNDSNHRYTPDAGAMPPPWSSEGVVFCAPR